MNNIYHPKSITLSLGGIALRLLPREKGLHFDIPETYQPFLSKATPDISIYVRREPEFDIDIDKLLFDTGSNWLIGLLEDKIIIRTGIENQKSNRVLILEPDLISAELVCVRDKWSRPSNIFFPLEYPLDMVLVTLLLVKRQGAIFHAAAIDDHGRGILFSGNSGAGKSTITRLWKGGNGVTLLSDDRIIIRRTNGQYRIYGTPWHGDAQVASPQSAPIDCIFFLKHAPTNHIVRLETVDATVNLLVCSFLPFWDSVGMELDLQFLSELVQLVPCYELNFVPDSSVIDYVKHFSGNQE